MGRNTHIPRLGVTNHIHLLRSGRGGMTQQELADRVGVSRQTVNAIEGGKYLPSLEVAFRIAMVFERRVDEVFLCAVIDDSSSIPKR
ncbi:MAG: helix-turn-helix transcriptional regulator [Phycisphaeraceae bacterium]|nr:helix-turn-helix transcriptional regulator [Phycisphaeraceae bacterium]